MIAQSQFTPSWEVHVAAQRCNISVAHPGTSGETQTALSSAFQVPFSDLSISTRWRMLLQFLFHLDESFKVLRIAAGKSSLPYSQQAVIIGTICLAIVFVILMCVTCCFWRNSSQERGKELCSKPHFDDYIIEPDPIAQYSYTFYRWA